MERVIFWYVVLCVRTSRLKSLDAVELYAMVVTGLLGRDFELIGLSIYQNNIVYFVSSCNTKLSSFLRSRQSVEKPGSCFWRVTLFKRHLHLTMSVYQMAVWDTKC